MKAVILAGGLGTRLRPYTKSLPKPMLPLGGKPILEYEIEWVILEMGKNSVLKLNMQFQKSPLQQQVS